MIRLGYRLLFRSLMGPIVALVAGVAIAALSGLGAGIAGGHAGVRYALGCTLAALTGRLPLRLGAFLDWACRAGLLRVSGAAYQFRHRELQRWLASH